MNLFDMLTNAQNGNGIDALARQFGLSQQQTQAAVEALLPAFSQGLKRNASDPYGVGSFLNAIANGNHAKYFEDAQNALSPQGVAEGNGILGHLFGSKDLSRAVASQAAQATGVGQTILQQMLPVIASMLMGGLSRQATGQSGGKMGAQAGGQQAAGFGGSGNPLQDIIEQMMRQGGGMGGAQPRQAPQQQQAQPADPLDNPFGKILKDMFGGQTGNPTGNPNGGQTGRQAQPGQPQAQNPFGDNPLGKIFEEMLKGAQGGGTAHGQPEPQSRPQQPQPQQHGQEAGRSGNPYGDLFGEMFETGRKQRDDYEKNIGSIFEQFTKGMDRYR